jgi:hypothetical protein
VLSGLLKNSNDIPLAFQEFFKKRYERTRAVQMKSRQLGNIYHAKGILRLIRNGVLKTTLLPSFTKQLEWIYAWKADWKWPLTRSLPFAQAKYLISGDRWECAPDYRRRLRRRHRHPLSQWAELGYSNAWLLLPRYQLYVRVPAANGGLTASRPGLNHPQRTLCRSQPFATGRYFSGCIAPATGQIYCCFSTAAKWKHAEDCSRSKCRGGGKFLSVVELAHFSLLGFAIVFDRWLKYGENCLISAWMAHSFFIHRQSSAELPA